MREKQDLPKFMVKDKVPTPGAPWAESAAGTRDWTARAEVSLPAARPGGVEGPAPYTTRHRSLWNQD